MSEVDLSMPASQLLEGPRAEAGTATDLAGASKGSAWSVASVARWVFSFPAMLATFIVGRVFYEGRAFAVDPDLWWHIKVGQNILTTHHWPTTDPFSFTVHGAPWMAYEWLGEVVFGLVARYGGLLGLDAFLIITASIVMMALYAHATMRSGNSKAAFVATGLLCSLAFASFNMRPQMFGYLFLVLVLIALERFHQGKPNAMWWLPALFLVWVNVHGSFIIGLGVLFVHWAAGLKGFQAGSIEAKQWTERERIRLELIFLLCLAVLPFTPYGTNVAVYPFDMAFSQPVNVANILEWRPMPFNMTGGKLFLLVVLGFFAVQATVRGKWRLSEWILLFGGVGLACLHVRFLLIFVPFFAPVFATLLAEWLPPYERAKDHFVLNALLMAGIVAAMVHYAPTKSAIEKIVDQNFPVQAVAQMKEHPAPPPMFNTYGFGGYLIYIGYPVFLDGRGDLFERGGVLTDYLQATLLKPGGLSVLDRYQIRSCILSKGEPLAVVLESSPLWMRSYQDSVTEIFVRR